MKSKIALRLASNPTIEAFKNSVKLKVAEAPNYLQTIKEENKKVVYDKVAGLNKWYNKLIGLDEVNVYLERVAALQKELLITQEKRREVSRQLSEIRQRASEVQDKIQHVDRKEKFNVYCELIQEEREVIFLERTTSSKFQEYDQTERELFTAFTNAIRDSHEKQRAQVEYTKYLGFILSITGSFLAFVYTTYRKNDLKNFMDEKLATLDFRPEPLIVNFAEVNERTIKEVMRNREIISHLLEQVKMNETVLKEVAENKASLSKVVQYLSNDMQSDAQPKNESTNLTALKYIGGFVFACIVMRVLAS